MDLSDGSVAINNKLITLSQYYVSYIVV